MNATRLPIDVDTLAKGDVIPVAEVERITGKARDTAEYRMGLMALRAFVERAFAIKGVNVTTSTPGNRVCILTDEDAVPYNQREFNRAMKKAKRAHFRQMGVDATKLTEQTKHDNERAILLQSRMLSAAAGAKRAALLAMGNERSTPSMLSVSPKT